MEWLVIVYIVAYVYIVGSFCLWSGYVTYSRVCLCVVTFCLWSGLVPYTSIVDAYVYVVATCLLFVECYIVLMLMLWLLTFYEISLEEISYRKYVDCKLNPHIILGIIYTISYILSNSTVENS